MSDGSAPKQSLITTMANQYGIEANMFKSTIVKTLFPSGNQNPSNEIVAAFLVVANQYNLNPFVKEIYAFPGKGGGIVPIVSIDGWNTIINRQPQYDGIEFVDELDKDNNLVAITAKLYRKDRSHPTMVTEYLSECKKDTEPWKKWPARMLRHKALIQAARYAFGFSGIYDEDEGARIAAGAVDDLPPSPPVAVIPEEQRAALVKHAQEMGVIEKLGEIVRECGFEMLAHITVDRLADVTNAITNAKVLEPEAIEAEVISAADTDQPEPSIHEQADDLNSATETLRDHVAEVFGTFDKNRQKDLLLGKPTVAKMNHDELTEFEEFLSGQA